MRVTPSCETKTPFFLSCRTCPFLTDCHGLSCLGSGLPCGQVTTSVRIQPHFHSWCMLTWHIPAPDPAHHRNVRTNSRVVPITFFGICFSWYFVPFYYNGGFWSVSVTKLLKFHWVLPRLRWDLLKSLMLCLVSPFAPSVRNVCWASSMPVWGLEV